MSNLVKSIQVKLKNYSKTRNRNHQLTLIRFNKRETALPDNHPIFNQNFANDEMRNAQWYAFLKKPNLGLTIQFEQVMEIIKNRLEPIYKKLQSKK